jgi:hypothetical protein
MNTPTMTLILNSCPNPDLGQTERPAPQQNVQVSSFAEASTQTRAYIAKHGLGGGNWNGGQILDPGGKKIARVSYNGRVWCNNACVYDPGERWQCSTLLDADEMNALRQDYENYHQLLRLADTFDKTQGRSRVVDTLFRTAGELLDEIIVELGGERMYLAIRQYLDHFNETGQPLPDFDKLCRWITRQAGLHQPNAHDLEGYYVIRLDDGNFEHCLHLTFDDEETLVIDVFDRVQVTLPFGHADLIAPPIFINLRTGQAWLEGSEPPQAFPLAERQHTINGSGDVDEQ